MASPSPRAGISFEQATPEKLELLTSLVESYYRFDHIGFDRRNIAAGLKTLLTSPDSGRAWFICCDGSVAGYVVLTFGSDHELGGSVGTITDLYIDAGRRGRGLGTAAMVFIEKQARALGLSGLELQVAQDNIAAQALYRKLRFVAYPRIPMGKKLS